MKLLNIAKIIIFTKLIHKKLPVELQDKGIIDNIANKRLFSLRMFGLPKYKEKMKEYIHVKKAVHLKDEIIFDFIIRPPNDKSEVVKNSLLDIPELKVKIYDDTNSETD
ncbi:hypothetical protein RhiirA4_470668 [Rhizophagus irregularis]|uniref:Uncharacterized protein n=1 Tax=Rhizophagus irregularis TaxID=588596 RepID=A0A2I1H1R8_9GLOM|nr:hypothetical protein RhiirA4_470668 [Rhizophagus irregularis]